MTTTEGPAPDHDRIQPVGQVPGWTENLLLTLHDGAARVAVWAHWSRIPPRPDLWEGVLAVYLPDGGLLVHRSFGRASGSDDAGTGTLHYRCAEPLQRWELRFDGMARRTSTAGITGGTLADGPFEPITLDVDVDGTGPTWRAHGMEAQEWGDGHLEQPARVRGVLRHGGTEIALDGHGFRDHTYGPRDYAKILGDVWLSGVFPSGRAVMALNVWADAPGAPAFATGFVDDGQRRRAVTGAALPRLGSATGDPAEFIAEITTDAGPIEIEVHAGPGRMNWTLDHPVGMTLGTAADPGRLLAVEMPARLTWDGEEADGWLERILRIRELPR